MSRADDLRAQLALAEAEDRLIAAKADKKLSADKLAAVKAEVRELRRVSREQREREVN